MQILTKLKVTIRYFINLICVLLYYYRPDGNSQLIRLSSPSGGTKFASISAKVKAKQLARQDVEKIST
jgi:hypothetical protein